MSVECRTADPLAPVLVTRAKECAAKVWDTVAGSGAVATEVRHQRARAAYRLAHGTPSGAEAAILRAEGYGYIAG